MARTRTPKTDLSQVTVTEHFWRGIPADLREKLVSLADGRQNIIGRKASAVVATLQASSVRGAATTAKRFQTFVESSNFKNRRRLSY